MVFVIVLVILFFLLIPGMILILQETLPDGFLGLIFTLTIIAIVFLAYQ